jgi:hypothetical protein
MNARIGQRPNLSVLRDDVRALKAYAVPSAVGFIKLDAMENPYTLPEALQRQLGERLAQQPLNRYPLSSARSTPDAGQRLRRTHPPGDPGLFAAGCDHHVAMAELLDVRVVDGV